MVLTRPQEPEGAQQEGLKKQQQQQPAELGGLEATANKTGFDFSRPTYGCDKWISSFDGQLPLIDLGCGLGEGGREGERGVVQGTGEGSSWRSIDQPRA